MTAVKPTGPLPGYTMPGYSQQNAHIGSDLKYSQKHQSHGGAGKPETNSGQFGVGTSLTFFQPHNMAVTQGFSHNQPTATVVQNSNHTPTSTMNSQTRLNTPQPLGNMVPYSSQNNQLVFKHQNDPVHSGNIMSPQPTNQIGFPPVAQKPPHGPGYSPYYGHHPVFPPRNSTFMPINYPSPFQPPAPVTSQKELDEKWLGQWLKQRGIKQAVVEPQNIAMKVQKSY